MIVSDVFGDEKPPLSEVDPLLPASIQTVQNYAAARDPRVIAINPFASSERERPSTRQKSRWPFRLWVAVLIVSFLVLAIYDISNGKDSVVDWPDLPDWMSDSDESIPKHSTRPGCYNVNTNKSSRFQQIIYAPNAHTQGPITAPALKNSHRFHLPLAADLIFLETNGSQFRGSLQLLTDKSVPKNLVNVDITVMYRDQAALDGAQICYLIKGKGQHGLGIYTKSEDEQSANSDQLLFDIVVRLPKRTASAGMRTMNAFRADMEAFAITAKDIQHDILVRSIQITTKNADISVESLRAENLFLSTSNGKISGTFNVTDSLGLMTTNAPINATISIANTEHEPVSQLYMSTTNAPIHTTLHLRSAYTNVRLFPPSFIANAHTTHGELSIRVPTQPNGTTLILRGSTSSAHAEVVIGESFEGDFALGTTLSRPIVVKGDGTVGMEVDVVEGGGKGEIEYRRVGWSEVEGRVWDERARDESGNARVGSKRRSSVSLQTTVFPATLRLL